MTELPTKSKQIFSTVSEDAKVHLALKEVDVRPPEDDEVVIRIEAATMHPSDFYTGFASAKLDTLEQGGTPEFPTISGSIPPQMFAALTKRIGLEKPIGNEGAGTVIAAGSSDAAQALMGKTVAVLGRQMFAEYITVKAPMCMPVADDVRADECAASVINPLTATGILETTKLEGFKGIVHTAAASTVGQFLLKLCLAEGFPLVNIVRRPEQAQMLREMGATHVCDSSLESFEDDLEQAIFETGAYMAFDAVGGGPLGEQILLAMERAALRGPEAWSVYGSTQPKCLYIYGRLDRRSAQISPRTGFAWRAGGWLTSHFRERVGLKRLFEIRTGIAKQVKTTFKQEFAQRFTLEEVLQVENVKSYGTLTTGKKYLVTPHG